MTPEAYQKAKALFEAGLAIPVEAREAWLAEQCADLELRETVKSLLQEHEHPVGFVDGPIEQGIGELLSPDGAQSAADRILPQQIGRYKILRVVGRGGMGTVYEAQQESPRRRVALKVIRSTILSPQIVRRFSQEAQVLGQLQHPGIAQIYEASIDELADDQVPYFAMEFVDGKSLTAFCAAENLSLPQRLELFARVCDAVQHAHQKGIIHRDLKPANILVTEDKGTAGGSGYSTSHLVANVAGQPKIVDFGIARMLDDEQQPLTMETSVGELVGTLCYMSPEQVAGNTKDIDTRCDVYALGVVLYELLAGRVPFSFRGLAITEAVRIVREDEPTRLGAIHSIHRGDLETIVAKAMEKQRDRRYATAAEFAADIRRYLRDEPIQARPATTLYQLRKFARRHKALVGGAAATAVALILGLVSSLYWLHQSRQRETQLQAVADFQGRMLTDIDVEAMGQQLLSELRTEAAQLPAMNNIDSDGLGDPIDRLTSRIDATGIASRLLDKQILVSAAETIGQEFADQPLIDAELRMSVGQVYDSLGLYAQAHDQFDKAHGLRRALLGDANPDTLIAARDVGLMLATQGKYTEAEPIVTDAVRGLRRQLGDSDPLVLQSQLRLAELKRRMSKFDEAERDYQLVLETARRDLSSKDAFTIEAIAALGNHYRVMERNDEAEALLREALAASRETLGDDNRDTISRMSELALLLQSRRQYSEAAPYFLEVHERNSIVYGADHPNTLSSAHSLAENYIFERKFELAEPLIRDVLAKRRRILGPEHPATLRSLNTLSHLLMRTHRGAEAADVLRESYAISRRTLGSSNNTTTVAALNLATTLMELGAFTEAEQFARIAYEGRCESFGSGHYRTISSRVVWGEILLAAGRFEACRELFASVLQQVRETGAIGTANYSAAISRLAQADIAIGKADEAEPLCRELLAFCRDNTKASPAITALAQRLLASSLISQHKSDEAKQLLEEALPELKKMLGEDHWQIHYTNALLCAARAEPGEAQLEQQLIEGVQAVCTKQEQIPIVERALIVDQLQGHMSKQ